MLLDECAKGLDESVLDQKKTKNNGETTPGPGHSAGQIGLLVPPYLALRAWHVQGCAFKRKQKKIPKPLLFQVICLVAITLYLQFHITQKTD